MDNLKKVGLTALAGSLAAVSANAAEMSVSGATLLTYTSEHSTETTGNPFGMKTNIGFTASGDVNGMTVGALRQGNFKLVKHLGKHEVGWYEPPEWNNMSNTFDSEDKSFANEYFVQLFDLNNDFDERLSNVYELQKIYDQ